MTRTEKNQGDKKAVPAGKYRAEVYFEHQGREIALVCSLYSGLEQVYLDSQLVSQSRNWRLRNVHLFSAGGVAYALEVAMGKGLRNLLHGLMDIQLKADGKLIDSDQFNSLQHVLGGDSQRAPPSWKRLLLSLLPFFIGGVILGFAVGYFGLKHFF